MTTSNINLKRHDHTSSKLLSPQNNTSPQLRWRLTSALLTLSACLLSAQAQAQLSQPDGTQIPVGNALPNILNSPPLSEGINVVSDASLVPEVFTPARQLTFSFVAEGGGYENAFGWYNLGDDVTNPNNRFLIFNCRVEPRNPYVTSTVNFCGNPDWKGGPIGFFLITPEGRTTRGAMRDRNCAQNDGQGYVYFSEPRLNTFESSNNPYIHHLVYRSNTFENAFYFGFEDLFRGGDNDFEDTLILVEGLFVGQAAELCDNLDDDCDGRVDEGVSELCQTACGEGVRECVAGNLTACSAPTPSVEVCDGLDNDCDGTVDEDLLRSCSNDCGEGAEVCVGGDWVGCTAPPQGEERCNNVDDDCDGAIDEALTQTCANGCGAPGTRQCLAGSYGACDAPLPVAEQCDGVDNDCDGVADEGLLAACQTDCGAGVSSCVNGSFDNCSAPTPSEELCDGIDNDCDGVVDEALTRACGGECGEVGEERCLVGAWVSCTTRAPVPERCNDFDDDCDGVVDEALTRACSDACGAGTQACLSGVWGLCQTPPPSVEGCDGLDNDCDGATDEGLGELCQTACGAGVRLCEGGALSACSAPEPVDELCDGIDNDCDGAIDEQLTRACGGACGVVGEELCLAGTWVGCTGQTPTDEVCNGRDEDCDGAVDEELVRLCQSACGEGTQGCVEGAWSSCDAPTPIAERCDELDNDCDGLIDEDLDRPCYSACGVGLERCEGGAFVACDAPQPSEELCDGLDSDCDGAIDEGLTRPCGGACGEGTEVCVQGAWEGCTAPAPREESCNAVDDDCDGEVDEGVSRACQTPCGEGTQRCELGRWSLCPAPQASEELCNAVDDDCDGVSDEEASCQEGFSCLQGRCEPRCMSNECPANYECIDDVCHPLPCALCRAYEQCQAERCVDLCAGVSCAEGSFCAQGECVEGRCATQGCEEGKVCLEGRCVPDDCDLAGCGPTEGCRLGVCFSTCVGVSCEAGEVCEAGLCLRDGCAEVSCEVGEVCEAGVCTPDLCAEVSCEVGEVCEAGSCSPDPCLQTRCPSQSRCVARLGRAVCVSLSDLAPEDEERPTSPSAEISVEVIDAGVGEASATPSAGGGCDVSARASRASTHQALPLLFVLLALALARAHARAHAHQRARALQRRARGAHALLTLCVISLLSACSGPNPNAQNNTDQGVEAGAEGEARCTYTQEVCNGVDDDCDGVIDNVATLESDPLNCGACGVVCELNNAEARCLGGECRVARCEPGSLNLDGLSSNGCEASCEVTEEGVERCDSLDNDCDGVIDEGFNLNSSLEHCGACDSACSEAGVAEVSCLSGRCVISACEEGYLNQNGLASDGCEYACAPAEGGELCNGADDDCDGVVDEGVEPLLEALNCLSEGLCRGARPTCLGGDGAVCLYPDEVTLEGEARCDGRDEDCDGLVDEGFEGLGEPCDGPDEDLCARGVLACSVDRLGVVCREAPTLSGERCDELDNDCDGEVDEGFDLNSDPQNCGACGQRCGLLRRLASCVEGVCVDQGCEPGFVDLNGPVQLGEEREEDGCEYACTPTEPSEERCDGLDNDCDGRIDEQVNPLNEALPPCLSEGVCAGASPLCQGARGFVCSYPSSYLPNDPLTPSPNEARCDGLDNDCDGLIDEGFVGLGELCDGDDADLCLGGLVVCSADGQSARCADDERSISELCDNADNDCDGEIDEGFDLNNSVTSCGACGVSCVRANTISACVEGVCVTQGCEPNTYDVNGLALDGCEYRCEVESPSEELCDGIDNDCDARVDEGLVAPPLTCPTQGVCEGLRPVCSGALGFTCGFPPTYEQVETRCDSLDNDCDGLIDEGFEGLGALCDGDDADLCIGGVVVCSLDAQSTRCADDERSIPEVCDGVDNDCDGLSDEGFDLNTNPEHCGRCGSSCLRANAVARCEAGACVVEGCEPGAYDANSLAIDGCEYLCGLETPSEELCDGVDNDCDTRVDEGLTPPADLECGAAGVCVGVRVLCDGAQGFRCAFPDVYEQEEVSCDRLDNDCDGLIDEAVPNPEQLGTPCEVGVGECARRAVVTCAPDGVGLSCGAVAGEPTEERCNGLDDDCDGVIDEQVPRATEMAQVSVEGRQVWVDLWEASRPDATATELGLVTTHACSSPNVRPWANVTLAQARAACEARGKRLCVEDEWRAACGAQAFPYGSSYDATSCVTLTTGASPTGSKPSCGSDFGGFDLSGNVAEWAECSRAIDCQLVQPALGGSFADRVSDAVRCDFRGNAVATSTSSAVGFRCCAD